MKPYGWSKAKDSDKSYLVNWLIIEEWKHLYFSSVLKAYSTIPLCRNPEIDNLFLYRRNGYIQGFLAYMSNRRIIVSIENNKIENFPRELLKLPKPHSILGFPLVVQLLISFLGLKEGYHTKYFFMKYHKDLSNFSSFNEKKDLEGKTIVRRKAIERDLPQVFPLERDYYQEAVIEKAIPSSNYDKLIKKVCLTNLKTNYVFIAEESASKNILSKIGINALGFCFVQIGGVYTIPLYRKKGLSQWLLDILLKSLISDRYEISLYVKEDNISAINLYKKSGFVKQEPLLISHIS